MTDPKNRLQAANDDVEVKVTPEHAGNVVALIEGKTAKQALEALEDPERENLERAVAIVNERFGGRLKVNLHELVFKTLPGNRVGESRSEGEIIDPLMVMHPAGRFARLIAHELGHEKGEKDPEGMVDTYVDLFLPDGDIEHSYDQQKADFRTLAESMQKEGESFEGIVEKIYDWYEPNKYEKIYERFEEMNMGEDKTDEENEEAYKFFLKVFPELEPNRDGQMDIIELEKAKAA